MTKLLLRWKDKKGVEHRRVYNELKEINRARKWLLDRGAYDVDVAVIKDTKEENKEQNNG